MSVKDKQKKPRRGTFVGGSRRGPEVVAVIGYGSQGRAIALNLQDSGCPVLLGLLSKSKSRQVARKEGIANIMTPAKAVAAADIVCFAFPDHLHGRLFASDIEPNLKEHSTLWFLHGTSVHFGFVKPAVGQDVILIAPHAPGIAVRREFLTEKRLSAFWAVHQDFTGKGESRTRRLALAIGIKKKNLIESSFEHEAIGDLFGEQAVLCGGLAMLIKTGFEVLVANGLKPENAYLEVAYQLDLIVQLIKEHGIEGMLARISPAARLGALEAGPKVIDGGTKKRMQQIFENISSGKFPRRLNKLNDSDIEDINSKLGRLSNPQLEKAARKFSG